MELLWEVDVNLPSLLMLFSAQNKPDSDYLNWDLDSFQELEGHKGKDNKIQISKDSWQSQCSSLRFYIRVYSS